jgi:hypothetical protein
VVHRARRVGGEAQAARAHVALDELRQAFLVDRHAARAEQVDLAAVDVEAHHLVAEFGQATARDKADVAGTENRYFHGRVRSRACSVV